MAEWASKGVAGTGLGLGAGALGLQLLGGNLGGLVGTNNAAHQCSENTPVNRYELDQAKENAELKSQIALRDANSYVLAQISNTKEYLEGKFEHQIEKTNDRIYCNEKTQNEVNLQQAAYNAANTAGISCLKGQVEELAGMFYSVTERVVPRRLVKNTCCPTTSE